MNAPFHRSAALATGALCLVLALGCSSSGGSTAPGTPTPKPGPSPNGNAPAPPAGGHGPAVTYKPVRDARYRLEPVGAALKPTSSKLAIGYVHNLSKRTALYATGAIVDNGNASQVTLGSITPSAPNATGDWGGGIGSATALPTPGGKSKGFEAGIRHFF